MGSLPEGAPEITREFLETVLHTKITEFVVKVGTQLGDNYLTAIYSIQVTTHDRERLNLVLKTYPILPGRQEFLNATNVFWKELMVYEVLMPELVQFGKEELGSEFRLPIPPFINGKAVHNENQSEENNDQSAKDVLQNYILMVDVRNTFGFKMADRCLGLDNDHCTLVIRELAKIHALNLGYRLKNDLSSLKQKFSFIEEVIFSAKRASYLSPILNRHYGIFKGIVQATFLNSNTKLLEGFLRFENGLLENFLLFFQDDGLDVQKVAELFRVQPKIIIAENWKCGSHGDLWVNNILFRYNRNGMPVESIFVDLQQYREACPTIDLAYFIYTSTTSAFRRKYLEKLLHLYSEVFIETCEQLKVEPLPGFCYEELHRRFHLAKVFGFFSAILLFPIIVTNPESAVDLDKLQSKVPIEYQFLEAFKDLAEKSREDPNLSHRVIDLVNDLFDAGVL